MKCQIARKRRKRSPRLRNWNRAMETRGEPNEQSNRHGCNLAGRMAGGLRVDSEAARQGANRGFSIGQERERRTLLPREQEEYRRLYTRRRCNDRTQQQTLGSVRTNNVRGKNGEDSLRE